MGRLIGQFVGGARVIPIGQSYGVSDKINESGHRGFRVTQRFGSAHDGIDLGNFACGDAIYAPSDGYVVNRKDPNGALIAEVHESDGSVTGFAHLSRFAVASGSRVLRGRLIGYVGSTGQSTGCHIHMGRRKGSVVSDPWPLLEQNRPARINVGVNIRNQPSVTARIYATTTTTQYRDAYVSGWHWVTGGYHGIAPYPTQWRKLWINGAYRYVARPLVTLL